MGIHDSRNRESGGKNGKQTETLDYIDGFGDWGFPKLGRPRLRDPHIENYAILGLYRGAPIFLEICHMSLQAESWG